MFNKFQDDFVVTRVRDLLKKGLFFFKILCATHASFQSPYLTCGPLLGPSGEGMGKLGRPQSS